MLLPMMVSNAATKFSNPVLLPSGLMAVMSFPGGSSYMTPGPSSYCRSLLVTFSSPGITSSRFSWALSTSLLMKAVSMARTRFPASSASMYRSSCLIWIIWALTNGMPRLCSGLSWVMMCSTFGYPVVSPTASTRSHFTSSSFSSERGCRFVNQYAATAPSLSISTPSITRFPLSRVLTSLSPPMLPSVLTRSASTRCTVVMYGVRLFGFMPRSAKSSPLISMFRNASSCSP